MSSCESSLTARLRLAVGDAAHPPAARPPPAPRPPTPRPALRHAPPPGRGAADEAAVAETGGGPGRGRGRGAAPGPTPGAAGPAHGGDATGRARAPTTGTVSESGTGDDTRLAGEHGRSRRPSYLLFKHNTLPL